MEDNMNPNNKYFSITDYKSVEDYYDTKIEIDSREIAIDLNFETELTNRSEIDRVNKFIDSISLHNCRNQNIIKEDFEKTVSMTSDYLGFYIEELEEEELAGIIDTSNKTIDKRLLLLEKLKLIRVGLYPQASYFATFDYSIEIDGEPCNQLLVINTHENGTLDYITWES